MTLFFTCGMTEGPHIGELFCHNLRQKVYPLYSSRAVFEFGQDFHSICAPRVVVFKTQRSFIQRMIKMLNTECHDELIFALPP